MAVTAAELIVKFSEEGANTVKGAVNDVDGAVTNAQKSVDKWSGRLKSTGTAITAGVTAPVVAFFTKAVFGASALEQAQGKVDAVFDESAASIIKWSDTTSTAMGISNTQALAWTGTLGNFFTSAGLATDQSAKYSQELVALSADMGAFNDVSAERATDAIIGGMAGEYDALQRLGVNITAAKVEQEAMNIATADGRDEITEADKALARYNVIMEETKNQHGQFNRESKGFAGQLAILKARFSEITAELGAKLMPHATAFLGWVGRMVDGFGRLSPGMQSFIVIAAGAAAALGPLLIAFGFMLPALSAIGAVITVMLGPIGLLIAAAALLAVAFTQNWLGIRDIVMGVADSFSQFFSGFKAGLRYFTGSNPIAKFLNGISRGFRELRLDGLADFFQSLAGKVEFLANVFNNLRASGLNPVEAAFRTLAALVPELSGVLDGLYRYVENLWQAFQALVTGDFGSFFSNLAEAAVAAFDTIVAAFEAIPWGDLARGALDLIIAGFRGGGALAGDLFGWVSDALSDALQTMSTVLHDGIQLAWDAITSLNWSDFIPVLVWASYIVGKIADFAGWLWGKISGFFPSASVIVGAIADFAGWVWGKISSFFPAASVIAGTISDFAGWVWGKISGFFPSDTILSGKVTAFASWLWSRLTQYFPSATVLAGSIADFAAWLWGKIKGIFPSGDLITGTIDDFASWLWEKLGSPTLSLPSPGDITAAIVDAILGRGGDKTGSVENPDGVDENPPTPFNPGGTGEGIDGNFLGGSRGGLAGFDLGGIVRDAITNARTAIEDGIADIRTGVIEPGVAAWGASFAAQMAPIPPAASSVFNGVQSVTAGALGATLGTVVSTTGGMLGAVSTNFPAMQVTAAGSTLALQGAVVGAIAGTASSYGASLAGMLSGTVSNFTSMHATAAGEAAGMRAAVVTSAASTALGVGSNMASMAAQAIGSANNMRSGTVSAAQSAGSGIASAIATGTSQAVSSAGANFGRLAGSISSAGAGAVGTASSLGSNIGSALASGLESMAGRVSAAASALANAASSAMAAALQVMSPSRKGIYFGRMTGEGLALGLEALVRRVTGSSTKLANAAVPRLSGRVGQIGESYRNVAEALIPAPVMAPGLAYAAAPAGARVPDRTATTDRRPVNITIMQREGESEMSLARRVVRLLEDDYDATGKV